MGLLAFAFESLLVCSCGRAVPSARPVLKKPQRGRSTTRNANTARRVAEERLTRRSHKPAASCTMAESIPKAKSAYAFFQAAMNKQMVGVPLG